MAEIILYFLSSLQLKWQIFIMSMIPVTELRASIPIGIALGLDPTTTWFMAVLGNLVPILPIYFLLKPGIKILSYFKLGESIIDKIFAKTRSKSEKVKKYGVVGLALFVSIPAPGTGVWTGTLLAFLFNLKPGPMFAAQIIGVVTSATIVSLASLGILELTKIIGWELVLIALIIVIGAYLYHKKYNKKV
ncbi:putative membrane protein [Desulfitispora alkaliphila]|uniref:COG2426 family protein n=1 Tax=Desulfitispora alkaliphila TaxID=622674 RepID=UPI003D225732